MNRSAERELNRRWENQRAAEIAAKPPKSGLIPGKPPREWDRFGNRRSSFNSPNYKFVGYSPLPNGKRAAVYERTGPPSERSKLASQFSPLLTAWGAVNGFTATDKAGMRTMRQAFGALVRKEKAHHLVDDQIPLLKRELQNAGYDVAQILSGKPLSEARKVPAAPTLAPKRAAAPPPVKSATDAAVDAFNQYVSLREAGNWTNTCLFAKGKESQINSGRTEVLRQLDAEIAKANPADLAELHAYRTQITNL